MFKKILSAVLSVVLPLAFFATLSVVTGCEDEGDRISVERRSNVTYSGGEKPVLKGD
jgi:hypothetical protein